MDCFLVSTNYSISSSAKHNSDIWFKHIVSTFMHFGLCMLYTFLAIAGSS